MGFLGWVMARLEGSHAGRAAIALALLLALPSLFSPLFMDEYAQANKWRASSEPSGRSLFKDCFVFAQPSTNQRKIKDGTSLDLSTFFVRNLREFRGIASFRMVWKALRRGQKSRGLQKARESRGKRTWEKCSSRD